MIPRHAMPMAVHVRCRPRKKTDVVTSNRMSRRRSSCFSFCSPILFSLMIRMTIEIMRTIRVPELKGWWLSFYYPLLYILLLSYVVMSLFPFLSSTSTTSHSRNMTSIRRTLRRMASSVEYCHNPPLISFVLLEMTLSLRLLQYASFCGLSSRFMAHKLMKLDLSLRLCPWDFCSIRHST